VKGAVEVAGTVHQQQGLICLIGHARILPASATPGALSTIKNMRSSHSSLALLITMYTAMLLTCTQVWGQGTSAPSAAALANPSRATPGPQESRAERIQVEDDSARIDELRIGGETRSISVTPKDGMPTYDVAPKTGERTWKVLGF
jgi:hypothetical protein